MLDKFRKGAQKAGIQASAFLKDGSSKIANEGHNFAQGFTLPGEADKAARILASFLGEYRRVVPTTRTQSLLLQPTLATPSRPSTRYQRRCCSGREVCVCPCAQHSHLTCESVLGLAIFSVLKAGFMFSGKAGSGIVIARLPDGSWSAPSCIATGGVGWGLQIGADITDFVIVLNSEDAVRAFSMGGNVTIGGNISAAAGPIGTGGSVQASLAHPAPMFSYSKSKGESGRNYVWLHIHSALRLVRRTVP